MNRLGYAIAAGVVTATVMAPTAQADQSSFVEAVLGAGITGSADTIINWGLRVCVDLGAGYSPAQISRNVWLHTDLISQRDGRLFVAAAIVHLCPRFSDTPYNGYKVA